jgi:hypothetical protein
MEYTRPLCYEFPLIRGEDVRAVQQALIALKVAPPCGGADGVFGNMTAQAVKAFQHNYNVAGRGSNAPVAETGVLAQDTWVALFNRASSANAPAARIQAAAAAIATPPSGSVVTPPPCLNQAQVQKARNWMSQNFGPQVDAAAATIGVDSNLIYAIACQETAVIWLAWIDKMAPDKVLAGCVFDSSGDAPAGTREAFPKDTAEFRARFGDALTQQFIDEANAARAIRGFSPRNWVYKGYGVFQYDLQNIQTDADFFNNRGWHDITACLDRFSKLFAEKLKASQGELRAAVKAYNGAGARAEAYATSVLQMREWCALPT